MIWVTTALAADVPFWSVDDFGASGALEDGWTSGYDDWLAQDGSAHPATDDSLEPQEFGAYGDGAAQDGWLVRDLPLLDGSVKARFSTQDDDAFGVVARYTGDAMYLAVYSEDAVPPPVHLVNSATVYLIRVEDGVGLVMGEEQVPAVDAAVIQLRANDDRVQVRFDGENVITFVDDLPLPRGQSGLYAYDCTTCLASSVEVVWIDEDDDGVPDDTDNCPDDVNPDQEDFDDDGEGDACDETPRQDSGFVESDPPESEPQDSSPIEDTGEDGASPSCGCGSGPGGGLLLALLAATSLRRRRRAWSCRP